jgi:hypothetical protein
VPGPIELPEAPSQPALPIEQHFSVREIADRLGRSKDTVRRLFKDEPGVVHHGNKRRNKRVYDTLSIPESVLVRVIKRLQSGTSVPAQPTPAQPPPVQRRAGKPATNRQQTKKLELCPKPVKSEVA